MIVLYKNILLKEDTEENLNEYQNLNDTLKKKSLVSSKSHFIFLFQFISVFLLRIVN